MPIFEYICEKCGVFDVLQLAGEKPLRYCPTCAKKKRKTKVTKKVSASAFHLKGTGWYKTDYVDNAKPAKSGKSSKATDKPESKTAAKSTAKNKAA